MSGPPSESADVSFAAEHTRRRLLRVAGAGAVGAGAAGSLGLASPAAAQAEDLDWEVTVGERVEDWTLETEPIEREEMVRPSATVEPGRVVIEGSALLPREDCFVVRPRQIEYAPDRDQLGVSVVPVYLPDHTDLEEEADCSYSDEYRRFELTVDLADDPAPGSAVVADYTSGLMIPRPFVSVCYPGVEGLQLPDAVTDYELDHEVDRGRRFEAQDPPSVEVDGDEVVVEGTVGMNTPDCRTVHLERVQVVNDVLEVELHEGYDTEVWPEDDCSFGIDPNRGFADYELRLSLAETPDAISVLDSGVSGNRRTVLALAGPLRLDRYGPTRFHSTLSYLNSPSSERPSVSLTDGTLEVTGSVEECYSTYNHQETLVPDSIAASGDEFGLSVDHGTRDVPGVPLDPEACHHPDTAFYELSVPVGDDAPETVAVRERRYDGQETVTHDVTGPTPTDLAVVAATPEVVALEWEPVESATAYEVAVDGEVGPVTSSPRTTLHDVEPGASHDVELRARYDDRLASAPATVEVEVPEAFEQYPVSLDVGPAADVPADATSAVTVSLDDLDEDDALRAAGLDLSLPVDAAIEAIRPRLWYETDPEPGDLVAVTGEVEDGSRAGRIGLAAWGDDPVEPEGRTYPLATVAFEDEVAPADVGADLRYVVGVEGTTEGPPPLGEYQPQPVGDGAYHDIDGDGDVTTTDVAIFQDHLFGDAVQDHAQFYNFSESPDGSVSHADVIALFQAATGL